MLGLIFLKINGGTPSYFDIEKGEKRKKRKEKKKANQSPIITHMNRTNMRRTSMCFQHCRGMWYLTARQRCTFCIKGLRCVYWHIISTFFLIIFYIYKNIKLSSSLHKHDYRNKRQV